MTQPIKPNLPVSLLEPTDIIGNTTKPAGSKSGSENVKASTDKQSKSTEIQAKPDVEQEQPERTFASFSIYHPSGYAVVKIINADTGEVLAQHPSTTILETITELEENSVKFDESR